MSDGDTVTRLLEKAALSTDGCDQAAEAFAVLSMYEEAGYLPDKVGVVENFLMAKSHIRMALANHAEGQPWHSVDLGSSEAMDDPASLCFMAVGYLTFMKHALQTD